MADRLGDGGGPDRRIVLLPPPLCLKVLGDAQVLNGGASHGYHQRNSVQPGPRVALEVVEADVLSHLLVRLLAHPARLIAPTKGQRNVRSGRLVR